MKILIINYYFPPIGRAHSYRWHQIASEWVSQGHEVSFITSRSHSERDAGGINIQEVGAEVSVNRFDVSAKNGGQCVLLGFKRILVNIYRKLYWPDGLWYWMFPLFVKLFSLRKEKYDLVISYSPTFVSHLGGLFYRVISSNKYTWTADYGDPFSISESMQPNNFRLYRRCNDFIEKKVLKIAYKVVFTNTKTCKAYRQKFGKFSSQIIPHAVDIEKFYVGDKVFNPQDIRLVYVGSFHKGIREPYSATNVIKKMIIIAKQQGINISFDVYGPQNGLDISKLESSRVRFHGSVSRVVAIEKIKLADFLVNIENSNCVMSPSKAVEYLATGIPILNFYDDELSDLFLQKYNVLNIQNKEVDVEQFVNFLMRMIRMGIKEKKEVYSDLTEYTFEQVAKKYLS